MSDETDFKDHHPTVQEFFDMGVDAASSVPQIPRDRCPFASWTLAAELWLAGHDDVTGEHQPSMGYRDDA
jgi:hypothetical protein